MSKMLPRLSSRSAIALLALLGALIVPASATATVETFQRFEVDATANYTINEQCPDGSTSR